MADINHNSDDLSEDVTDFVTPDLPGTNLQMRRQLRQTPVHLSSIHEYGETDNMLDGAAEVPQVSVSPMVEDYIIPAMNPALRYSRSSSVAGEITTDFSPLERSCSCIDKGLTGWDCLYTNDDYLVWPPRDTGPEEAVAYKKVLLKDVIGNNKVLTHEIHHVCRMNFVGRLEVICKLLQDKDIGLDSASVVGDMTETPLHVAVMYDATEAAVLLIQYGGAGLVLRTYNHALYNGTTALHQALSKQNRDVIHSMMACLDPAQKNQLLHAQATGSYFRGKFFKAGLPLSLAALVGNKDIFDDLVKYGAQVDAVDNVSGNNVIHSLVQFSSFNPKRSADMYTHVLSSAMVQQWWLKRRGLAGMRMTCSEYRYLKINLLKKTNFDGCTPLALSAAQESVKMCATILQTDDVYRFPQWRCGPTALNYYDVSEIDTSLVGIDKQSVLDIFLYGSDMDNLDFCEVPAVRELLMKKWESYRWIFYLWFLVHLAVMILLTLGNEKRIQMPRILQNGNDTSRADTNDTPSRNQSQQQQEAILQAHDETPLLFPEECVVLIAAAVYALVDLLDLGRSLYQVFLSWRKGSRNSMLTFVTSAVLWRPDVFRTVLLGFSVSYLAAVCLRGIQNPDDVIAASAACVFGWAFLLSFASALKNIGIFTVMLQRMLMSDLVHFCLVFVVIMIGFSAAFRLVFLSSSSSTTHTPSEIIDLKTSIFNFWRLMCGLSELDIFEHAAHPTAVKILFLAFVLMANILLLNMLIAAMSDTYSEVAGQKHNLWLRLRGKSVTNIEYHLPKCLRPKLPLEHRQRMDDQGNTTDLYLLPVEEYAKNTDSMSK